MLCADNLCGSSPSHELQRKASDLPPQADGGQSTQLAMGLQRLPKAVPHPDRRGHAGQATSRQKDATAVAGGGVGQANGPPLLTGWAWHPGSSISPSGAETVTLNDPPYRAVTLPRQPKEQHSKRPTQAKTQTLVTGRLPMLQLLHRLLPKKEDTVRTDKCQLLTATPRKH